MMFYTDEDPREAYAIQGLDSAYFEPEYNPDDYLPEEYEGDGYDLYDTGDPWDIEYDIP